MDDDRRILVHVVPEIDRLPVIEVGIDDLTARHCPVVGRDIVVQVAFGRQRFPTPRWVCARCAARSAPITYSGIVVHGGMVTDTNIIKARRLLMTTPVVCNGRICDIDQHDRGNHH